MDARCEAQRARRVVSNCGESADVPTTSDLPIEIGTSEWDVDHPLLVEENVSIGSFDELVDQSFFDDLRYSPDYFRMVRELYDLHWDEEIVPVCYAPHERVVCRYIPSDLALQCDYWGVRFFIKDECTCCQCAFPSLQQYCLRSMTIEEILQVHDFWHAKWFISYVKFVLKRSKRDPVFKHVFAAECYGYTEMNEDGNVEICQCIACRWPDYIWQQQMQETKEVFIRNMLKDLFLKCVIDVYDLIWILLMHDIELNPGEPCCSCPWCEGFRVTPVPRYWWPMVRNYFAHLLDLGVIDEFDLVWLLLMHDIELNPGHPTIYDRMRNYMGCCCNHNMSNNEITREFVYINAAMLNPVANLTALERDTADAYFFQSILLRELCDEHIELYRECMRNLDHDQESDVDSDGLPDFYYGADEAPAALGGGVIITNDQPEILVDSDDEPTVTIDGLRFMQSVDIPDIDGYPEGSVFDRDDQGSEYTPPPRSDENWFDGENPAEEVPPLIDDEEGRPQTPPLNSFPTGWFRDPCEQQMFKGVSEFFTELRHVQVDISEEANTKLRNLVDLFGDRIDGVANSLGQHAKVAAESVIPNPFTSLPDLWEKFLALWTNVESRKYAYLLIAGLLIILSKYVDCTALQVMAALVIGAIATTFTELGTFLIKLIYPPVIVEQVGIEMIEEGFMLLSQTMAMLVLGVTSKAKDIRAFVKELCTDLKDCKGLKEGIEFFVSYFKQMCSYIGRLFNIQCLKNIGSTFSDIKEYANEIVAFVDRLNRGDRFRVEDGNRCLHLNDLLLDKLSKIPRSREFDAMRKETYDLILLMKPLIRHIGEIGLKNGPTVPAVGIMLGGPVETGKSFSAHLIAEALCSETLAWKYSQGFIPVERLESFVQNKNCEIYIYGHDKHNEGYWNQMVCFMDEFGAAKDKPGDEVNDYVFAMKAVNVAQFSLPMAFERKGQVFFSSEYLLGTTNLQKWDANSLNEVAKPGFGRRWTLEYWIVPQKRYCLTQRNGQMLDLDDLTKRRFDQRLVPPPIWHQPVLDGNGVVLLEGYFEFDVNLSEAWPWNFEAGEKREGPPIPLSQIAPKGVEEHIKLFLKHSKIVDYRNAEVKRSIIDVCEQYCTPDQMLELRNIPMFAHVRNERFAENAVPLQFNPPIVPQMFGLHRDNRRPYDDRARAMFNEMKEEAKETGSIWQSEEHLTRLAHVLSREPCPDAPFYPVLADEMRRDFPDILPPLVGFDRLDSFHTVQEDYSNLIKRLRLQRRNKEVANNWSLLTPDQKSELVEPFVVEMTERGYSPTIIAYMITLGDCKDDFIAGCIRYRQIIRDGLVQTAAALGRSVQRLNVWLDPVQHPFLFQVALVVTTFGTTVALVVMLEAIIKLWQNGGVVANRKYRKKQRKLQRRLEEEDDFDSVCDEELEKLVTEQMYTHTDNLNNETNRVLQNMVNVWCVFEKIDEDNVASLFLGQAVFGCELSCVVPSHFGPELERILKEKEVQGIKICKPEIWIRRFTNTSTTFDAKFYYSDVKVNKIPGAHVSEWILPKCLHFFPDIRNKFPSIKDKKLDEMLHSTRLEGKWMYRKNSDKCIVAPGIERVSFYSMNSSPLLKLNAEGFSHAAIISHLDLELKDSMFMDVPTVTGDCGSIGIIQDTKLKDVGWPNICIAYMHTHYHTEVGMGMGQRLYREYFSEPSMSVKSIDPDKVLSIPVELNYCDETVMLPSQFEPLFYTDPLNAPTGSKIIPSVMRADLRDNPKFGKETKRPAKTRPGMLGDVFASPQYRALSGYCLNRHAVNHKALSTIGDYMTGWYHNVSVPVEEPYCLTDEESIIGKPSLKIDPIVRKTSPGWLFNKLKTKLGVKDPGKTYWFGDEGPIDLTSEAAKKFLNYLHSQDEEVRKANRIYAVHMGCNKDERLSHDKVDQFICRAFFVPGMDFIALCRKYLAHFAIWFVENKIRNNSCVGVNPYRDWTEVYLHLVTHPNMTREECMEDESEIHCIFGDFSKFDKRMLVAFIYMAFQIIESFYWNSTQEERNARMSLCQEFVNSIHIITIGDKGVIYEWVGANTSGNFITSIINTIVQNLYCLYVLCDICLMSEGGIETSDGTNLPLKRITNGTSFILYGDDSGLSVSNDMVSLGVNQCTMTESFQKTLGMTYTDAEKTGNIVEYRKAWEGQFLSRGFIKNMIDGVFRVDAPLKDSSLFEPMYWSKKGLPVENTVEIVQRTLFELSLRGEVEFDYYAPDIIRLCYKHFKVYPLYTTWAVCYRECAKLDYAYNL